MSHKLLNNLLTFLIVLTLSSCITTSSFAQDADFVEKGKPAPYDGILLTVEKANESRNAIIQRDRLLQENEKLEDGSITRNAIYFLAGAIIAGIVTSYATPHHP